MNVTVGDYSSCVHIKKAGIINTFIPTYFTGVVYTKPTLFLLRASCSEFFYARTNHRPIHVLLHGVSVSTYSAQPLVSPNTFYHVVISLFK
jgi:hypothetical protein